MKDQVACKCDSSKLNELAKRRRSLESITRKFDRANTRALTLTGAVLVETETALRGGLKEMFIDRHSPLCTGHYLITQFGTRYEIVRVKVEGNRQWLQVAFKRRAPVRSIIHRVMK
jgi:hypothetical protein